MYQQWLPAPPILPTDRLSVRITNLYMYVCVCVCMSLTRPPSMTKSQKWPSPDCREGRAVIRRSRLPCNAIQLCTKKLLYVLSHADTLHPRTSSKTTSVICSWSRMKTVSSYCPPNAHVFSCFLQILLFTCVTCPCFCTLQHTVPHSKPHTL